MGANEPLAAAIKLAGRLKRRAAEYDGVCRGETRVAATGDATYEVDVPMERVVRDFFLDLKLPCRVMTEDTGITDYGGEPEYVFMIDPLDGSRNARRGLPFYCASIAVYDCNARELSQAICAVVERFDAKEEFVAMRRRGATLNGRRIRPSKKTTLKDAVLALGSHFAPAFPHYAKPMEKLGNLVQSQERNVWIKCYGSTALELAYLACGRIDLIFDDRAATAFKATPKTYDIAAGVLLCLESGAILEYGSSEIPQKLPLDPRLPVQLIGAGNRKLFKLLSNTVRWA